MASISNTLFVLFIFGLPFALAQQIISTTGQRVHLSCQANSTGDLEWFIKISKASVDIFNCTDHIVQCTGSNGIDTFFPENEFEANRSNGVSILSLSPVEKISTFECMVRNQIVQTYTVLRIDTQDITALCNVRLPSIGESGDLQISLICGFNSPDALNGVSTIEGIGIKVSEVTRSSQIIKHNLQFDNFTNIHNASCMLDFPGIGITRHCIYPNIIRNPYIVQDTEPENGKLKGKDIIVQCDVESDVDWHLIDLGGREEDIKERSWIRDEGRSLLIRNISERDVGKVVVCRTKGDDNQTNKGTVGFTVISKISEDKNKSKSEYPALPPSVHSPYLVLTLLFLSLWLITTAVGGVLLGIRTKRNKSGTLAIASASGNASVPNGGSGERETSLFSVGTGARGDPDTSNTNNSAHIPVFEPEVNSEDGNNRNRQSNNESHLYFTLEKSSPSPMNSLPRASTARWEHHDTNAVSLNQPQSSHWQGYETVGEPNKGAASSYDPGEYAEVGRHFQGEGTQDLGEYAEVGKHFHGKGTPDLGEYAEVVKHSQRKWPPDLSGRPSIRKKPGREKVKENDISRLYSTVNK